jgi:hypothetical protein
MKKEINCTTGEITERELNAAELAQYKIDAANELAQSKLRKARADAKANAQAKLEALGLTVEDLQALGL